MRAACVSIFLASVFLACPAPAQTTRPAEELARENAELKKRIEKLEAYAAELEKKLRNAKPTAPNPPSVRVIPRVPAPYGYELPAPPFRLPSPPIVPSPRPPETNPSPVPPNQVVPGLPRQSMPEQWKRQRFNGVDYYVVPLE